MMAPSCGSPKRTVEAMYPRPEPHEIIADRIGIEPTPSKQAESAMKAMVNLARNELSVILAEARKIDGNSLASWGNKWSKRPHDA